MHKIKFKDGTKRYLSDISSNATQLTFSVLDDVREGIEEICKDKEKTSVIQFIEVNEDTQDESVLKGYAGYTNLVSMKTEYGVVTSTDYETVDNSTDSGFVEEKHDVTTVILGKPTKIEAELESIKESQTLQDGAIEELATVVSELAEG